MLSRGSTDQEAGGRVPPMFLQRPVVLAVCRETGEDPMDEVARVLPPAVSGVEAEVESGGLVGACLPAGPGRLGAAKLLRCPATLRRTDANPGRWSALLPTATRLARATSER